MTLKQAFLGSALVTGSMLACSQAGLPPPYLDDQPEPNINGDAGRDTGRFFDVALGEAGQCTELPLPGSIINRLAVPQDLPPWQGGAPLDGFYILTDAKKFVGASGMGGATSTNFQESAVISGNTLRITTKDQGANATTSAYTFTINPSDAGREGGMTGFMDWKLICSPDPNAMTQTTVGYTVTGGTFSFGAFQLVDTLTKNQ